MPAQVALGGHRRERRALSAAAGAVLAFAGVVVATATGILYRTLTSPAQVVVVALVFLLISWALGHLLDGGNAGAGAGLAAGGLVSAVLAATSSRGGYAVALLVVAAVGLLIVLVERRERGMS